MRCCMRLTTERFPADSRDPPRAGLSNTSRGNAKKRHQEEAEPVLTASDSWSAQVLANRETTVFGMRLMTGELSLHKVRKSPCDSGLLPFKPSLACTYILDSVFVSFVVGYLFRFSLFSFFSRHKERRKKKKKKKTKNNKKKRKKWKKRKN